MTHRLASLALLLALAPALGAQTSSIPVEVPTRGSSSLQPAHQVPSPNLEQAEVPVKQLITERRARVLEQSDSAEAWGRLGMALDIHDLEAEAIVCYRRAIDLDGESFRWWYYLALALTSRADSEAIDAFERARALKPSYEAMLIHFADLLADQGRNQEAAEAYRAAVDQDGNAVGHGLAGLARLALADGDLERAHIYAREAMATNPRHGTARGLLTEVYRRQGNAKEADRLRRQGSPMPARLVDPLMADLMDEGVSSYWHHQRSRFFLSTRQAQKAEAEARAALALSPRALFHQDLARALLAQERDKEAESELRRAVELAPNLATSHQLLGRLFDRAGRRGEAIESLRQASKLRPDSEATRILGQLLMQTGRREEGIRLLRRSLDHDDDSRTLLAVAWTLATTSDPALRDPKTAESYARRLLDQTPEERPEALDALAASLAGQGRMVEAVAAIERALLAAEGQGSTMERRLTSRLELYRSGKPYLSKR